MGEFTKIEWATHTFNAWYGCTKVGPPCEHCYAEGWAKRSGLVQWGPHAERRRSSPATWAMPRRWASAARPSDRPRVFCLSLGDWLDNQVPQEWRQDLAYLILATPELDWLLLTKRIQNYEKLAPWPHVPVNVWLGITCGDQQEYDRDWPLLRRIQCSVKFISYEPALGPIVFSGRSYDLPDWIIYGGESGPGAREMDPAWAYAMRRQCGANRIPFFMKQMSRRTPIPADLFVRQFPSTSLETARCAT